MTTRKNIKTGQTEDFISIRDLFYLCLSKWHWFVISFVVITGIACLYLLTTPPVYTRSASILIKDDSKGKSLSADAESFADFGLFQSNTNVNNELVAFQSPVVILEVIKRMHLETDYHIDGHFYKEVAYGPTLPVTVSIVDFPENESATFILNILADETVELRDFKRNGESVEGEAVVTGNLWDTVGTPLGQISIEPTPYYTERSVSTVYVSRSTLYEAVSDYASQLSVVLNDEKSSIINLSFTDVSIQRAEDVLNMLISVYNENWVKDKNRIAVSTSMFIGERLRMIELELGNVDADISSYKSKNLLPDIQAASAMYMAQSSEANARILELNNQLYMTRYVRDYLTGESNKNQLLPANSGIESSHIESEIAKYNTRQLQRNGLVANSSARNPLVIDLDQALASMRKSIVASIDNRLVTLNTEINALRKSDRQTTSRIATSPMQAQYLLSVERQQKVKEALYLFLLQKREENELSQAFTAYNTRVITPPTGKMIPTAPVKRNILLAAIALGLLFPVVVIFIRENVNTTIRGRKDLENITVLYIGEVPLLVGSGKYWISRKKQPEQHVIAVKAGKRDVINEAFRVLRTNLEFMTGKDGRSNVILLTSFNPGSGKTFLSINIAMSLAIKGKKVLVIDADLRRASASSCLNASGNGLSDYLGKQADHPDELIVTCDECENLNILPAGTIPPNPTELLEEERFGELINRLRARYDYIFIDCPPIHLVADTQIIEKLADRTLFVVRAGLTERAMLAELERIYTEEKFKNMSLVLNGTTNDGRYGYRYGYKYGYQ